VQLIVWPEDFSRVFFREIGLDSDRIITRALFSQKFCMTTSLRVLLIGSGGREHALAWKLSRSPSVDKIFVVPGNGGTDSLERTTNVDLNPSDFNKLVEFAVEKGVTLVVPGPEQPLVDGVEEVFRKGSELPVWPKRMNE
jgi:hypothetical protein